MTSPHSPKERGGLATFTANILQSLENLGLQAELVVFDSPNDQKLLMALKKKRQLIINIHFMALYNSKKTEGRVVNFVHGSEICLTSPNPLKALYKKLFRNRFLNLLEQSFFNIFISEFTLKVAAKQGLNIDYSRDLIIPNAIAMSEGDSLLRRKDLTEDRLVLSCIARDVPHKNIDGVVLFCELLARVAGKQVELWLAPDCRRKSTEIDICYIDGSDSSRDELYRRAHLNLLLSLDQQNRGFFEGFGLVVLEAAQFYTPTIGLRQAGLSESIHDGETGWLIERVHYDEVRALWLVMLENYQQVAQHCHDHTRECHDLSIYESFLGKLL